MRFAVLVVLAWVATSATTSPTRQDTELAPGTACPEYCTCNYGGDGGVVAECERITPNQHFDDQLVAFHMNENTDETNALKMDRRFFVNLQMKSIDSIVIVNVDIDSIDVNAFQDLDYLRVLNLTNTNLRSLDPETFAHNSDIELLSLSNNPLSISQDRNSYILNAPGISELDLSSCQLSNLPPATFSRVSGLNYLNLASNNLTTLEPGIFANLTFLEDLNLSNNNLESLDPKVFSFNSDLVNLVLKNNRLTSVENIAIPSLTKLDLSFCLFTKLSSKSFKGFPEITLLNLSGNGLTTLDASSFSSLLKLNYLDLSNNNLRGPLPEELFIHNQDIEKISLQDNPLMKKLPENGFIGSFDSLYMFDVSNCGLNELSTKVFESMPFMARLYLSGNSLISFSSVPAGLSVLHMSNNKITSLDDIIFSEKSNIRQLMLDGNQISYLTPKNFDNLPSLSKLDLSSCGMERLWSDVVDKSFNLETIRELKLSNNQLTTISQDDLQVFSQLEWLDVLSNPLKCDKDLQDTVKYMHEANVYPIRPENSPDNDEKYTWRSVLASLKCSPPKSEKIKIATSSKYKPESTTKVYDQDDGDDDDDDDYDYEKDEDNVDNDDDSVSDVTLNIVKKFDRHGGIPTLLNISPASYQVIVLITVAVATFISIVLLALIFKLCNQRLSQYRGHQRQRSKRGSMSYRPLFNNEKMNTPTTPIFRPKNDVRHPAEEEMENVVYRQTVGPVSFLPSSYNHPNYQEQSSKMNM